MKKIKYKFALILYASGAGKLISLHHRAGYPKGIKGKRNST
jgi:hypothetical protein